MRYWNKRIQSLYLKFKDNWIFVALFFILNIASPYVLPKLRILKDIPFEKLLNFKVPLWSVVFSLLIVYVTRLISKYFLSKSSLRIIGAVYGLEDKTVDITKKLNDLVENNRLKVVLSNNIDGDPYPGFIKQALIEYQLGRNVYSRKYIEGDVIDLP